MRAVTDLPAFLDHMHDALDAARAGVHFEEGGCWGMALALRDALAEDGIAAALAIQDGFCHAMAVAGGTLVDHGGTMPAHVRATLVDDLTFNLAHEAAGSSDDDVEADRAWAAEVISVARDFAARATPAPG